MKTRKTIAWLLCLVMIFSVFAVFPANATPDLRGGGGSGGGGGGGSGGGGGGGGGGADAGGIAILITYMSGYVGSSESVTNTQAATSGVEFNLELNTFVYDGHEFLYWSDANGNTYSDGAAVTFQDNVTLTAVWTDPIPQSSIEGTTYNIMYSPAQADNDPGGYIEVAWNGSAYSTVTVVPHTSYGYRESIEFTAANGSMIFPMQNSSTGVYSFTMPASDVTIAATFTKASYRIDLSAEYATVGGLPERADVGDTVSFLAAAHFGYRIVGVYISGSNLGLTQLHNSNGCYSFVMPDCRPTVTVIAEAITSDITYDLVGGGTYDGPASAAYGDYVYVTLSTGDGYEFASASVTAASGAAISSSFSTGELCGSVGFTMPAEPVTVHIVRRHMPYSIYYDTDDGVTLDSAPEYAYEGEEVTISYTVADGYEVQRITVNGDRFGESFSSNPFSFTMPDCEVTIEFDTEEVRHDITSTVVGPGGVTAPASARVGETVTVSFNPVDGGELVEYSIRTASGDDIPHDGEPPYDFPFIMPDEDVVITARFVGASLSIDYETNDTGVTLVSAPTSAREGEEVTVSFTVADGYKVQRINVDGDRFGESFSSNPFSFTMPDCGVTIEFETEEVRHNISAGIIGEGSASFPFNARLGENVTVTFTPASGHAVGTVSIKTSEGSDVAYTGDPADGSVSFIMPDSNVVMSIRFWGAEHSINYSYNSNFVHLVSAPATARKGEEVTVSVTVDDGYRLNHARVTDGASFDETFYIKTFKFEMPDSDVDVTLVEEHKAYTITKNLYCSDQSASILCQDTAYFGDAIAFEISFSDPDDYLVTTINVRSDSGERLDLVADPDIENRYYFTMPNNYVTISVFASEAYQVTFSPNGGTGDAFTTKIANGSSVEMPYCDFTPPEGKIFAGWDAGFPILIKPGYSIMINSDTTVNAVWYSESALYAGIDQTNGALSLDLYVEMFDNSPQKHALMISGGDGTFQYTLDENEFEQVTIDGKTLYKYSVELTASRLVEGVAYVLDEWSGNEEWIMTSAGLISFTADPTAAALSVSTENYDTGVAQIQPTGGEFFFRIYPLGTDVKVTYPGVAPTFYGDADSNGEVELDDVILLLQYLANYDDETFTSSVDVGPGADADANYYVELDDVILLLQYLANYDDATGTSSVTLGPQN